MTATPGQAADVPEVTEYLLDELAFRYAVPRCCRVCAAPLQVADSRGMKMTCTSDAASPLTIKHEAAGATWKEARDHYAESTLYDPPDGDWRVLALVAEVRRLRAAPAQKPHAAPGPDVCECGHAWAHHAFSDDVCAVAGCPCTRPRPAQQAAPELAAAMAETRKVRDLLDQATKAVQTKRWALTEAEKRIIRGFRQQAGLPS